MRILILNFHSALHYSRLKGALKKQKRKEKKDSHHGKSLTHWGRVTHICVSELTIIGSDNGLSPGRRQAIIWNNDGLLLIGPLGTNFSENLIEILTFSFTKMQLKVSSAKWRPFCLSLNVLKFEWLSSLKPSSAEWQPFCSGLNWVITLG